MRRFLSQENRAMQRGYKGLDLAVQSGASKCSDRPFYQCWLIDLNLLETSLTITVMSIRLGVCFSRYVPRTGHKARERARQKTKVFPGWLLNNNGTSAAQTTLSENRNVCSIVSPQFAL